MAEQYGPPPLQTLPRWYLDENGNVVPMEEGMAMAPDYMNPQQPQQRQSLLGPTPGIPNLQKLQFSPRDMASLPWPEPVVNPTPPPMRPQGQFAGAAVPDSLRQGTLDSLQSIKDNWWRPAPGPMYGPPEGVNPTPPQEAPPQALPYNPPARQPQAPPQFQKPMDPGDSFGSFSNIDSFAREMTPQIAPTQRLSPPPGSGPLMVPAQGSVSPEDYQKAIERVKAQGQEDLATKYRAAAERERALMRNAGKEQDLANLFAAAGENMSASGAAIRTRSGPPKFSTSTAGSAMAAKAAGMEKDDLLPLEEMDPASDTSRGYQKFLTNLPGFEQFQGLEQISARQLKTMLPWIENSLNRDVRKSQIESNMASRLASEEYRQTMAEARKQSQEQNLLRDISKIANSARKDQNINRAIQTRDAGKKVEQLLLNASSTSDTALMTILPRFLGEVGALSDSDINRNMRRMGFVQNAQDVWSQKGAGALSPAHRKELLSLVKDMRDTTEGIIEDYMQIVSGQQGEVYKEKGYPAERIYSIMKAKFNEVPARAEVPGKVGITVEGQHYYVTQEQLDAMDANDEDYERD